MLVVTQRSISIDLWLNWQLYAASFCTQEYLCNGELLYSKHFKLLYHTSFQTIFRISIYKITSNGGKKTITCNVIEVKSIGFQSAVNKSAIWLSHLVIDFLQLAYISDWTFLFLNTHQYWALSNAKILFQYLVNIK